MYLFTIIMTIITIDGNIGCGKSSVLNYLHKIYKIPVDLEPVENWSTFLSNMYENKADVFKFQIKIWLDRCWVQEKSDKTVVLMERSPYFIKNTFIQTALEQHMITENELNILHDLHSKTDYLWLNNKYIYLRSNPENCYKRIKKRNRPSEKHITSEYIETLHKSHEDTYHKALADNMQIHIINVDDKTIAEIASEIISEIQGIHP